MSSPVPAVTVIVPTTALAERADLLRQALQSVLGQEGVRSIPVVVINGPEADPSLRKELEADPRLRVVTRQEPSLPRALAVGHAAVRTPWFTALDDDDLLLPGALRTRIECLEARPESGVVVTNGYERHEAGDRLHVDAAAGIHRDPLRALLRGNWLLPGSWLCRTDAVAPDLFDRMPSFLECTYLAIRFSLAYHMAFLDRPTVVWRVNAPRSVSHSPAYVLGQAQALRDLIALDLPPDVRAEFKRRLGSALHDRAAWHAGAGEWRDAWRFHVQSLRARAGWRYLPFTWRLVSGMR